MNRWLAIVPVMLLAGCGERIENGSAPLFPGTDEGLEFADQPTEAYRRELLQLGFDGVSKMPLIPHIKNRSRAQQKVVDACSELGQPELARSYIEQIENWQYWLGYANLAHYFAGQGDFTNANRLLKKVQPALRMADERSKGIIVASTPNPRHDSLTDWRYEAVLTRVAEVQNLMQQAPAAVDAEKYGELNASKINTETSVQNSDGFKEAMVLLDPYTVDPNFEIVHVGFVKMADLFTAHYDQVDLPGFIEAEVLPKTEKMPVFLRIDIFDHLAQAAMKNGDTVTADSLIEKIDELVQPLTSSPQFHIPEAVKLVRLRHDIGRQDAARAELDALFSGYVESRDRIVNIYRAALLCRMAEAYVFLGDPAKALELYSMAVEEGQVNPNARPQADDLNEICCSMALAGVAPAPALRTMLLDMNANLDEPW